MKIVTLGDSITKGIVLDNNRYRILPGNFVERCSDYLQMSVDNLSMMGCTVSRGAAILERHADRIADADLTIIEYGGNDSDFDWQAIASAPDLPHGPKTALVAFRETYTALIKRVRDLGSRPVLLSLPLISGDSFFNFVTRQMPEESRENVISWLGGCPDRIRNYHDMYNLEVFRLGSQWHVPVLDITTPFLCDPDYRRYLCGDGIHPNADGHKLIADALIGYARRHG